MGLIRNIVALSPQQQISLSLNIHSHTLNWIQFGLNFLTKTDLCGLKIVPSL